jgi:DNA repair protein RadC
MEEMTMTKTARKSLDIVTIQMKKERKFLCNGDRVTMPQQAAEAFCGLVGNPDRECFVALLLDSKNRITALHLVSQGSLNQSIVHPRETFKAAILANAAAVILAHNHPTGDLTPSSEDIAITRRLKDAGELLGIQVLDHIIVDTDSGDSRAFTEMGLL